MNCTKLLTVICVAISLVAVAASPATAQVFLDLYGGVVFPRAADTEAESSTGETKNTSGFEDTFVIGGRTGSWGTEANLGWFGMPVRNVHCHTEPAQVRFCTPGAGSATYDKSILET